MSIKESILAYKAKILLLYVSTIGLAIIMVTIPFIEGRLIDSLVYIKNKNIFIFYCLILLGLGIGRIIFSYFTTKVTIVVKQQVTVDINKKILHKILRKDSSQMVKMDLNYLNFRVNDDLEQVLTFFFDQLPLLVTNVITVATIVVFFFFVNKIILLSLVIIIPLYFILFIINNKKIYISTYFLSEKQTIYNSILNSIYNRYVNIKSNETIDKEIKRLEKTEKELLNEKKINYHLFFNLSSIKITLTLIFQLVFFILGGFAILNGYLTIGLFTVTIQYFSFLLNTVDEMFSIYSDVQKSKVSWNRLSDINKLPNDIDGFYSLDKIRMIEVRDYNFSYDGEKYLFPQNLNFKFETNNIYGITGKNGAGKTTFLLCLIGLLKNFTKGEIYYNKNKLSDINMKKVREESTSVFLNSMFVDNLDVKSYLTSIREMDEIYSILEKDVMKDFFDSKYFSIYDNLSKNIDVLSSGERQMVYILGTILKKNTKLYVFDEPSSNLFDDLIPVLRRLLDFISKDKIVIVITHEPKLLKGMKEIYLESRD
ncbi:ABC transporter ATP-binding protein [Enterococcus casseliflavus]|uniref:ABC transporter ATP-binding protein n=2 Tax=Enterococcus casseliflavus TaxID=37734 RepID=UPI003015B544